jgi:hypothetical protein
MTGSGPIPALNEMLICDFSKGQHFCRTFTTLKQQTEAVLVMVSLSEDRIFLLGILGFSGYQGTSTSFDMHQ